MANPRCRACDSSLNTIEYQSRAADEAQRRVTACGNCPLDAAKLSVCQEPLLPHCHLKRSEAYPTLQKLSVEVTNTTVCMLYVKANIDCDPTEMHNAVCSSALDSNGNMYRLYLSGPYSGSCIHEKSRHIVGPCIEQVLLNVGATVPGVMASYTHFTYSTYDTDNYVISYGNSSVYILMKLRDHRYDSLKEAMQLIYTKYIKLPSLDSFLPRATLNAMSNLSARGYDSSSVQGRGHVFVIKADGERLWLTRIGKVWVFSRRLLSHSIIGWHIECDMYGDTTHTYGPVLDVEVLLGHKPVLIDVLMSEDGVTSPRSRNIQWAHSQLLRMLPLLPYLRSVHMRNICHTYKAALEECARSEYPTDGVVALPPGSMDMVKLKPVKSIELVLMQDGNLYSSDNVALFRVPDLQAYSPGSIYEVGFTTLEGQCHISYIFVRPDKAVANNLAAIRSVVLSSLPDNHNDIVRTALWRWSNRVRAEVYRHAFATRPGRRIVLDIGTGDGQSSDEHIKSSECSFILVEPDETKCRKLRHRLQLAKYETDPRILMRHLSALKNGRLRYCVLNCKLEDLLEDGALASMVMPEIKCIVACFSMQFIADVMRDAAFHGIPFVGCCYVYDGVEVGSNIFDSNGIYMRRTGTDTADVKWGRDEVYVEPAIETCDFPHNMTLARASELVKFRHTVQHRNIARLVNSLVVAYST